MGKVTSPESLHSDSGKLLQTALINRAVLSLLAAVSVSPALLFGGEESSLLHSVQPEASVGIPEAPLLSSKGLVEHLLVALHLEGVWFRKSEL